MGKIEIDQTNFSSGKIFNHGPANGKRMANPPPFIPEPLIIILINSQIEMFVLTPSKSIPEHF